MNFGECRPFVVYMSKAHSAAGLFWAIASRISTVGCGEEVVAPGSEQSFESENARPADMSMDRDCPMKAAAAEGHWWAIGKDGLAKNHSFDGALLAEEHVQPSHGFRKGVLATGRPAVRSLCVDRLPVWAWRVHGAKAAGYLQRISQKPRPAAV